MMSRRPLTPSFAAGLVVVLAVTACQSGSSKSAPAGNETLRADLDRICNAKKLSGADQDSTGQGTYMLAQWLDANITSDEGHAFLIAFAKLGQDRAARRKLLEDAAAKHGIRSCPLIDDWR